MQTILKISLLVLCAVGLRAQQTWVVSCVGGAGVDFTDVPPAIAAAAPGDTILVNMDCPCGYQGGYLAAVIDKPLHIVGLNGCYTSGTGTTRAAIHGDLAVTGIAAGECVVLSNIGLVSNNLEAPSLTVSDCQGRVLIEDLSVWVPFWSPTYTFVVDHCADVTFRGCDIDLMGQPIEITDSNVLMTNTWVWHSYPSFPFPVYPVNPPGIVLTNSTLTVVGSILEGMFNTNGSAANNATPAVELHDSLLRVGPASTVRGGWANGSYWRGYIAPQADSSVVHKDSRAVITSVSAATVPPPTAQQMSATWHSWVIANQPYAVSVAGPNLGWAILVLGELVPATPTPIGMLSVDPLTAVATALVPLPAPYATYEWNFHCPSGVPSGAAYAFQGLTLAINGTIALTQVSPFTVAWEIGVDP